MRARSDSFASSSAAELRERPRSGLDLRAEIASHEIRGGLPARTRDVSVGGACLTTPSPFSWKAIQRVRLWLPDGMLELEAEGLWQQVLRHDDVVMTGVAFPALSGAAAERLWDLVFDAARDLARFLHTHSALRGIGLEGALGLAQLTRTRDVAARALLYAQGPAEPGERSVFVVERGAVTLQMRVRDAREIAVERLGPGSLFGGLPLLAAPAHTESAIADVDTRLLEIDEGAFDFLGRSRPWLAQQLAAAVTCAHAQRLQRILERVRDAI